MCYNGNDRSTACSKQQEVVTGMLTRPEVDEAEAEAKSHEAKANSREAKAEAKIALFFRPNFTFWSHFLKNNNFSVDFRRNFKYFGSKRALTWGFISKHP